jgi:hypothetical protein
MVVKSARERQSRTGGDAPCASTRSDVVRAMLAILGLTVTGCGSVTAGTTASTPTSIPTLSQPSPTPSTLPAAAFADHAGWTTGSSSDFGEPSVEETFTWVSTAAFRDVPFSAPPGNTLRAMAPDDVLVEVFLWRPGPDDEPIAGPTIDLPPRLDGSAAGQGFPGSDESRWFQRTGGRVGDRMIDVWVFAGRPHPTAAQVESAQAMLDTLSLPDWPAR